MEPMQNDILNLLRITPSLQSEDYVSNKQQFKLHTLLTEQRHPKTWNLSSTLRESISKGLEQIFSVDKDISFKFKEMAGDTSLLEKAADAVARSILQGNKIYIYGCGATGRLAKVMESALWRPFWKKAQKSPEWEWLTTHISDHVEDQLIGELTGGDRAFISSLEGFEDLELIGRLQLEDHGIKRGDPVFCITEGGETSSVIGTIHAALDLYGKLTPENMIDAQDHLYFIYNNPDEVLRPFERSRTVFENPAITKINLTTGPQAITGSTRMQAATSETFLMGIILEAGIYRALHTLLDPGDLSDLGFSGEPVFKERLLSFDRLVQTALENTESLKNLTVLESDTYGSGNKSTYFAGKGLLTVFTDCTERSPTFRLSPLDSLGEEEKKSWIQVWTEGKDPSTAWFNLLGRDFKGLDREIYKPVFTEEIQDSYLKASALESLRSAGNDQKYQYDFSLSPGNIDHHGPGENDLGVIVCIDNESDLLRNPDSDWNRFLALQKEQGARIAVFLIGEESPVALPEITERLSLSAQDIVISLPVPKTDDPLGLNRQTLLKILLNGHSTAVMARLGRVVGNTMTHVNPSNLKLIGRATYLILSHVNDIIRQEDWIQKYGEMSPLTYGESNTVLFDAIEFAAQITHEVSEVELSIIRILEALRTQSYVSWKDALSLAENPGLEDYLALHNPRLMPKLL